MLDLGSVTSTTAVPVVRTDRGGQVTYHGPGQVVGYPVCRLPVRGRGVRRFVAAIEHSLCDLALGLGVGLMPRRGLPGAWTGPGENPRKVGFVGLGVHRAVTMHGFALNLDRRSIDGFEGIEVCGLPGVEVSSLESLGACPPPEAELLAGRLARALSVRSDRRWVPTPLAAEDLPVGDFAGARAFSDRLDGRRRLERSRDHSRALFLG